LTGFYVILGAIVVVGAGALWLARRSGEGPGVQVIDSIPAPASAAFEGYVLGSDSAPVTIVEYADFECGACAQFAILTGPDIKQRLVQTGRVRWIFRDFPIEGHRNSLPAHLAAACAAEQGRFWEMHDQLYFNHRRWVLEARPARRIRELAAAIPGVDARRFNDCLGSARYQDRILASQRAGVERGVSSTPTFDINNLRVSGAIGYDSLRVLVDRVSPPPP
jgi:protein-disulfide isomerase